LDKIVVEGGVPLRGTVQVSGAKNAALPIVAAALLAEGDHTVRNLPDLADVRTFGRLLRHMGCEAERHAGDGHPGDRAASIRVPRAVNPEAPYDLVKTMRASVLVLGPLLARWGEARVSLPGGCAIGARPIDQHLKGLAALGAEIRLEHGYVHATVPRGRLLGAAFTFDGQTVTGTENVMMAAALAEGETVLRNCAREPEVKDLADALVRMGARIEGAGTDEIRVRGVESLRPVDHTVIADRIEAGTFLVAGALPGGDVTVKGCVLEHLEALVEKLRAVGAEVREVPGGLRVIGDGRPRPVDVKTQPHPGFPTDMQAQVMVLLSLADGSSRITETVFENRFMHVQELQRLGADISVDGKLALVRGVPALSGAPVMASDLRASAALVLAGLAARGTTEIQRVYHLDRGYERIEEKLAPLGARIRRAKA
jgi:UDP-N-acetylglucosamine 1-carboxyvinyltransferase